MSLTTPIRLFTVPVGSRIEQTDNGDFIVFLPDRRARLIRATLTLNGVETEETDIPPVKIGGESA